MPVGLDPADNGRSVRTARLAKFGRYGAGRPSSCSVATRQHQSRMQTWGAIAGVRRAKYTSGDEMTGATLGMDFQQYRLECRKAYVYAVMSGSAPLLLSRFGGAIAIAAKHVNSLWIERGGSLWGLANRDREPDEVRRLANRRWTLVEREIAAEIQAGHPPTHAVRDVMQRYGTWPHTIEQIRLLMRIEDDPTGGPPAPSWVVDLRINSARLGRSSETMANTFGAIFTTVALIATAENWTNATPAEWDQAVDIGQAGVNLGELGGAVAGMGEARAVHQGMGANVQPASQVAEIRSMPNASAAAAPHNLGGSSNRGADTSAASRGTENRGVPRRPTATPAGRGTAAGHPSAVTSPKSAPDDIDAATGPNPTGSGRSGRKPGQPTSVVGLNAIAATRTPAGRKAIAALVGRFPAALGKLWEKSDNARAQKRLAEVRRLWASTNPADQEAAKLLARKGVFDRWRGRFWRRVRKQIDGPAPLDPGLKKLFAAAGLEFPVDKRGAPFWRLPDGTRELLTVDHFQFRIMDDPTRCIEPRNLVFSPKSENSGPLEAIRDNDLFQREVSR